MSKIPGPRIWTPTAIKQVRARHSITQAALADLLGISLASIQRYERGAEGGTGNKIKTPLLVRWALEALVVRL